MHCRCFDASKMLFPKNQSMTSRGTRPCLGNLTAHHCGIQIETITRTLSKKVVYCSNSTKEGSKHLRPIKVLGRKPPYDLSLDERVLSTKFHCICSYRVQVNSEQTNEQTSFFIYIDIWLIQKPSVKLSWNSEALVERTWKFQLLVVFEIYTLFHELWLQF